MSPGWLKLAAYIVLLPLILVQAEGWRRPIRAEKSAGLVFGTGLGVLYSARWNLSSRAAGRSMRLTTVYLRHGTTGASASWLRGALAR